MSHAEDCLQSIVREARGVSESHLKKLLKSVGVSIESYKYVEWYSVRMVVNFDSTLNTKPVLAYSNVSNSSRNLAELVSCNAKQVEPCIDICKKFDAAI